MKVSELLAMPHGICRDLEAAYSFGGWQNVAEILHRDAQAEIAEAFKRGQELMRDEFAQMMSVSDAECREYDESWFMLESMVANIPIKEEPDQ